MSLRALSLNNLGEIYFNMGGALNNAELLFQAEPLFRRALKIDESVLGEKHPATAAILNNLGMLYHLTSEYSKAEQALDRALTISEKTLGSEHPQTATALRNLIYLYLDAGKVNAATKLVPQLAKAEQKNLANILSFASEQQRLSFQRTVDPYTIPAALNMGHLLAETILREKGVVLDSLLEDRLVARADPREREVVATLNSTKQRLMRISLEMPKEFSEDAMKQNNEEKDELSQRINKCEAELALTVTGLGKARRALRVTVSQVQVALAKDEALIELLNYPHYVGNLKFEPRYGAVIIPSSGTPKWTPLGGASEIEKTIRQYQTAVREQTDEQTFRDILSKLHSQIWAPIERALPKGTERVILSPDGDLSFVSFAALLGNDDKFVGERYSIAYAASGRDLLNKPKQSVRSVSLTTTVFANPDFERKTIAPQNVSRQDAFASQAPGMQALRSISFSPLPTTVMEADALARRANASGAQFNVFLGSDASETELRRINSPLILHLATHGFFLPDTDPANATELYQRWKNFFPRTGVINPMYRSGLALAGAQSTLQSWNRGEIPPTQSDGIVTAEEVGELHLDCTWLVVLSACDTGLGAAQAGEGVMGLRRGFIQAGAQNVMMTLWPIGDDENTVQIMSDFYDVAEKTRNAPQALADVQRKWLVKLRSKNGLRVAVVSAGPFIMSGQGRVGLSDK